MSEQDALAELRDSLPIDINRLHLDAREQPGLADKAGQLAAEAKATAKRAKLKLEISQAEANQSIRADPEAHGLAKVTESAVQSAVVLAKDVVLARRVLLAAERDADLAAAIANAFEHRRSMIKVEADLYANNYWGEVDANGPGLADAGREGRKAAQGALERKRRERKEK